MEQDAASIFMGRGASAAGDYEQPLEAFEGEKRSLDVEPVEMIGALGVLADEGDDAFVLRQSGSPFSACLAESAE